MLSVKQKIVIEKALKFKKSRKLINEYCESVSLPWFKLDVNQGSELIDRLFKISWK